MRCDACLWLVLCRAQEKESLNAQIAALRQAIHEEEAKVSGQAVTKYVASIKMTVCVVSGFVIACLGQYVL